MFVLNFICLSIEKWKEMQKCSAIGGKYRGKKSSGPGMDKADIHTLRFRNQRYIIKKKRSDITMFRTAWASLIIFLLFYIAISHKSIFIIRILKISYFNRVWSIKSSHKLELLYLYFEKHDNIEGKHIFVVLFLDIFLMSGNSEGLVFIFQRALW